jgi:hypothetical protein
MPVLDVSKAYVIHQASAWLRKHVLQSNGRHGVISVKHMGMKRLDLPDISQKPILAIGNQYSLLETMLLPPVLCK